MVEGKDGKTLLEPGKNVLTPAPENRWGVWISGSGDFGDVDSDGNLTLAGRSSPLFLSPTHDDVEAMISGAKRGAWSLEQIFSNESLQKSNSFSGTKMTSPPLI
jgi:hypothetical protein